MTGQRHAILEATMDVVPHRFPAVVDVSSSCAGVLISPSHVLTAAHCVDSGVPQSVSFTTDGTSSRTIGVAQCWMHPAWAVSGPWAHQRVPEFEGVDVGDRCAVLMSRSSSFGGDSSDFAVLQLNRPIPHPVPDPTSIGAGDLFADPLPIGEAPSTTFGAVAVSFEPGPGRWYRFFDAPGAYSGTVENSEIGIEPGDSGGPLLQDLGGSYRVVGVVSTQGMWAALTPAKISWIQSRVDTDGDSRPDSACKERSACRWVDGYGTSPLADASTDADGDGYLDASEDTCPGTYNPCQEGGDLDGDGTPDDCDACPLDDAIAQERGALVDADVDLVPDACDCQSWYSPLEWSRVGSAAGDSDCDYLDADCDNCRNDYNPAQENEDGDSLGDACDVCRAEVDDLDGFDARDTDDDGTPDACDNCDVANLSQSNCNIDAELELWAQTCPPDPGTGLPSCPRSDYVLGDACDPTPCGDTGVGTEVVGSRTSAEGIQNAIRVDARASEPRDARTGFRFCRCPLATGRDTLRKRQACHDVIEGEEPTGSCGPLDVEAYVQSIEPPDWRWPTMAIADDPRFPAGSGSAPALRPERALSYAPADDGTFRTDLWATWDLRDADAPRWRTRFDETLPTGLLANVPGVFWTHSPGPPGGGEPTEWTRELASHFWAGRARMSIEPVLPDVERLPCFVPQVRSAHDLRFGAFPVPWIGFASVGCGADELEGLAVRLGPHVLEPQLGFDPAWLSHFQNPVLRWVAVEEPPEALGDGTVRYVALDPELALQAILVEQAEQLDDALAAAPCPSNECPAPPFLSVGEDPLEVPLLLSAQENTLWAVDNAAKRDLRPRVYALDLSTRRWQALSAEGVPWGRLLAWTRTAIDGTLWVLDEVDDQGSLEVRLLRVHLGNGEARSEVAGVWTRATVHDRFDLSAGPDGALYLACGYTDGSSASVIMQVDPATVSVTAVMQLDLSFVAGGLWADRHGVTLLVDDEAEGGVPTPFAHDAFGTENLDMGRCL